jgi:hypothetical protein
MDRIVDATLEQIDAIVHLLVQHFQTANTALGVSLYQTQEEVMRRHISERLQDPTKAFAYFTLIDDSGRVLGLANTLLEGKRGEVLAILGESGTLTEERVKLLLQHAIDNLRQRGAVQIRLEVGEYEPMVHNAALQAGGKLISTNFVWVS